MATQQKISQAFTSGDVPDIFTLWQPKCFNIIGFVRVIFYLKVQKKYIEITHAEKYRANIFFIIIASHCSTARISLLALEAGSWYENFFNLRECLYYVLVPSASAPEGISQTNELDFRT